jgi:hypothetical protein
MGGACSTHRIDENTYNILVRKPEGKRLLGRFRHKWDNNIRMDVGKIGWEVMDWMNLVQERDQWRHLVNTVMKI